MLPSENTVSGVNSASSSARQQKSPVSVQTLASLMFDLRGTKLYRSPYLQEQCLCLSNYLSIYPSFYLYSYVLPYTVSWNTPPVAGTESTTAAACPDQSILRWR